MNRFYAVNPLVAQPMDLGTVGQLPGELLFKAGAAQQEKFDKVNKGLEDVGDLLNIKVDEKDLPDLKKKQAYYNDRVTNVAKNMSEGKITTGRAALDLLDIKKEIVSDDFVRTAPQNYENVTKAREFADKLSATQRVSPHNRVFEKDYTNWPSTIDPATGKVRVFSSVGAYVDAPLEKDLEEKIDNVKENIVGDVKNLGNGKLQTSKLGEITRERLIEVMKPALDDFYIRNKGEIERRKEANNGIDFLGTLDLEDIVEVDKKGNKKVKGKRWADAGLIASKIDERVVRVSDVDIKGDPNWSPPAPPKEQDEPAPWTAAVVGSAVNLPTVDNYEDYKATKDDVRQQIEEEKAKGSAGNAKRIAHLEQQEIALKATEYDFIQKWIKRNPKGPLGENTQKMYDEATKIISSSDAKYDQPYTVKGEGIFDFDYETTARKEAEKKMDILKEQAFADNEEFDTYLKNNKRSETPTIISLPGQYATKASSVPGEGKTVKYMLKDDLLTDYFRKNAGNFEITEIDGSESSTPASQVALVGLQRQPDPVNGRLVMVGNLVDDDGNITETQVRVTPKNPVAEKTSKDQLLEGYRKILDEERDPKTGKFIRYVPNGKLQSYLDVKGLDTYTDLIDQRNPNATFYIGKTSLKLENGMTILFDIKSRNSQNEYQGKESTYKIEYFNPLTSKKQKAEITGTLKDVAEEITKVGIALE